MLKIILADDDRNMRFILRTILSSISGIEDIAEVSDGQELINMLDNYNPDVIFLDIDMPVVSGLEAAKEIFDFNPKLYLIFATAYDCYKSEAFEVYAFDYLIKPFNPVRIRQTIRRIKELKQVTHNYVIQQCPVAANSNKFRLSVQSEDGFKVINLADIVLITRFDRKTVIYTAVDILRTNESLQEVEKHINSKQFFRCHKSYIVNTDMVKEIIPWGSKTYLVKLANTTETALMTLEKVKEFRLKYCLK